MKKNPVPVNSIVAPFDLPGYWIWGGCLGLAAVITFLCAEFISPYLAMALVPGWIFLIVKVLRSIRTDGTIE